MIGLESERFEAVMQAMDLRYQLHHGEFQPYLSKVTKADQMLDGPAIERLAGAYLASNLKVATDELYRTVDDAVDGLAKAGKSIPTIVRDATGVRGRLFGFEPAPPQRASVDTSRAGMQGLRSGGQGSL